MNYNFDKLTDRRTHASLKWDVKEHELPMWVADMDFETAPVIVEALQTCVKHKIFGYSSVPEKYFTSIQQWWLQHHHVLYKTEWMMFCTGVVPAISSIIRHVTNENENVVIQSPVYNIFYNSILNNGRHILSNDLVYENGEYCIDFEDLERKLADPQTTLMILCNPHNPIGKIWNKETLQRIGDLCIQHHVLILSDEIHCDIVDTNTSYVPFASISMHHAMNAIACVAPTKAFNLAGLQTSCIIVANDEIRRKVHRGIHTDEVAEPNSFAITASITAFEKGEDWLQAMCSYVKNNKNVVRNFIRQELSYLHVVESKATYLLWIDCSFLCENADGLVDFIRKETGLYVSKGSAYGNNGKAFIRMNVACPLTRLQDGLKRLKQGIQAYQIK